MDGHLACHGPPRGRRTSSLCCSCRVDGDVDVDTVEVAPAVRCRVEREVLHQGRVAPGALDPQHGFDRAWATTWIRVAPNVPISSIEAEDVVAPRVAGVIDHDGTRGGAASTSVSATLS